MVRVLTGAQVQEERAHENYIRHLDLKPSSYKFYFKSNPTPAQLRKGGPWGVVRFSAPVWNGRCSFNNQHGVRCGRRTVFGIGYCWQHLEDKRHLKIGPSLVMKTKTDRNGNAVKDLHGRIVKEPIGRGVFADDTHKNKGDIVFKRDHVVMLYQGEVVSDQEAAIRYGLHTNPYTLKATERIYNRARGRYYTRDNKNAPIIDAALLRGVGAIINHKPHQQANVYFKCQKIPHTEDWVYKIIANRDILNGEELYVDYGDAYGDFTNRHFPTFTTQSKYVKDPAWY